MRRTKGEGPSLAGDSPSEVNELPGRLDRYSKAKTKAVQIASYFQTVKIGKREEEAHRSIDDCGAWLLFKNYFEQDSVRLASANFCRRHLLCPLCAIRRGAKALQAYLKRYDAIQAAMGSEGHLTPFMVTLTVKDGPDLLERFNRLHRSFQALNKQRHGKGSGHSTWTNAKGGVASYEVKRGEGSGLWHPHLHAIVLCHPDHPVDAYRLSAEWLKITGDSFIVDIRPIREDNDNGVIGGFSEVFKYAVKFSSMEHEDVIEAWRFLQGKRMLSSFGLFYGVRVSDKTADEQLCGEYMEMLYRYHHEGRSYEQHPSRNEGVSLKDDPKDLRLSRNLRNLVENQ